MFWIILVVIAIIMINITNLICKYYLPASRKHLYLRLLLFDIESYSFPIAYLITVLLMLLIEPFGITSDSYLYSWKEGYSYDSSAGSLSAVFVAYTSVIMLIASVTQFDLTLHNNNKNNNNKNDNNNNINKNNNIENDINNNNNNKDRHDDKYDNGCSISSSSANDDDSISDNSNVTLNVIINSNHLNIDGTHVRQQQQQQQDHNNHHHQQQQLSGQQQQDYHGDGSQSKSISLVLILMMMMMIMEMMMI